MADATITVRLLDAPEVKNLLNKLRELALVHCQGCDGEADHRSAEMLADGFQQQFVDFGYLKLQPSYAELRAENERLRAALQTIYDHATADNDGQPCCDTVVMLAKQAQAGGLMAER